MSRENEKTLLVIIVLMFLIASVILVDNDNLSQELKSSEAKMHDLSIATLFGNQSKDIFYNNSDKTFADCFDEGGIISKDETMTTFNESYFNTSKCIIGEP